MAKSWSVQVSPQVTDTAPQARVRWLTGERLHITIKFIGEVDDDRTAAIAEALEPALNMEPFELAFAGTGAFPTSGPPRLLWAGVGRGRDELTAAERKIVSRLAPLGVADKQMAYHPHLTLARVRDAGGLRPAWNRWESSSLCSSGISPGRCRSHTC